MFYDIALNSGFSENIKKAYKAVTNKDVSVHFVMDTGVMDKKDNGNYNDLLDKLSSHEDEIDFF